MIFEVRDVLPLPVGFGESGRGGRAAGARMSAFAASMTSLPSNPAAPPPPPPPSPPLAAATAASEEAPRTVKGGEGEGGEKNRETWECIRLAVSLSGLITVSLGSGVHEPMGRYVCLSVRHIVLECHFTTQTHLQPPRPARHSPRLHPSERIVWLPCAHRRTSSSVVPAQPFLRTQRDRRKFRRKGRWPIV